MRLVIRSVGNSLGVIIPRSALEAWGVGKGDVLELTARAIRPMRRARSSQEALDELKRRLAAALTARCSANEIRAHSLANLYRWQQSGAWISAYDEWRRILEGGDDGELFAEVQRLNEEAST